MSRLIAIGDVHGRDDLLRGLLRQIDPRPQDHIIFLGDLIDRGPASRGVMDTVLELKGRCAVDLVLGNHEEMMIGASVDRGGYNYWLKFGGREALQSFGVTAPFLATQALDRDLIPPRYWALLGAAKDLLQVDDWVFTHAGLNPERGLQEQDSGSLRWKQLNPSSYPHRCGKTVVCGHTPQRRPLRAPGLLCLDTGCGTARKGYLTACEVCSGSLWTMSSARLTSASGAD